MLTVGAFAASVDLIRWEILRICRGGGNSLTFSGAGFTTPTPVGTFEPQNVEQGISNFEVRAGFTSAVRHSLFGILYFLSVAIRRL